MQRLGLAVAIILCGGTIKGFGVEIKIDIPIGDGIKKLREALQPNSRALIGYGIRGTTVKLSKAQHVELMKYDPKTQSHGGFQSFLISLQLRVNKSTRKLDLSDTDIDKIIKHGSQPHKGGWQKSINRIFGSHFNLPNVD